MFIDDEHNLYNNILFTIIIFMIMNLNTGSQFNIKTLPYHYHDYNGNSYISTVFKLSVGLRTLTAKIWVGPANFPSLSYINFRKIVLWYGKFQILFWRLYGINPSSLCFQFKLHYDFSIFYLFIRWLSFIYICIYIYILSRQYIQEAWPISWCRECFFLAMQAACF